ncbi:MAG: GNAT family N-acetyltransferase [Candidatus Bathyarchaeota archaeon]|nr:GNAT family N-acetyltransferase [Candidatus Bathyarchaeota archaeon]
MSSQFFGINCTHQDSITVENYSSDLKEQWNGFLSKAKNGLFLFSRDYMEYHSDRFIDHSLMFSYNGQLVAVLPANIDNGVLYSHAGLTFGGIVSEANIKTPVMLKIFSSLIRHCTDLGIKEIVYKAVPYIYHSVPAEEDLYALFIFNAQLITRNVSSCIYMPEIRKFDNNRKDNIRKAVRNDIVVKESFDFESFMKIEQETLSERHGVKPVHSVEEIKLLAGRFPNNIKLFASYKDDVMVAGVIMYESKNVAHMQYAANSKEGWNIGAQDIIEDYLINEYYREKKYFDFGISTEKLGQVLNLGLIKRKENFGASAVMYDIYQIIP